MNQNQLKQQAAIAAIDFIDTDITLGVGTGSTVNFFIEALATVKGKIDAAVASSKATEVLLKKYGIPVYDLNSVNKVDLYVDGADEFNQHHYLVKGGGGALTREKIIAAASEKFVCIADESKRVDVLGKFPVPVEVIPMARGYVARQIVKLGGDPEYREGFVTDNGNIILDVRNLNVVDPIKTEKDLNNIVGVVTNGLFAANAADVIVIATENGIETF